MIRVKERGTRRVIGAENTACYIGRWSLYHQAEQGIQVDHRLTTTFHCQLIAESTALSERSIAAGTCFSPFVQLSTSARTHHHSSSSVRSSVSPPLSKRAYRLRLRVKRSKGLLILMHLSRRGHISRKCLDRVVTEQLYPGSQLSEKLFPSLGEGVEYIPCSNASLRLHHRFHQISGRSLVGYDRWNERDQK